MSTPSGPEPNTGRILEPSHFTLKEFKDSRVYPNAKPDVYGQVDIGDKDRSQQGEFPGPSDTAHYRADTDSSMQALHHTLGTSRTQAAQGDHQHDGITGAKIGPLEIVNTGTPTDPIKTVRPKLTVAATAADIRAFLHNFFEFRDV